MNNACMAYALQEHSPGNLDAEQDSEDERDATGNIDDAENLVNLMNEFAV